MVFIIQLIINVCPILPMVYLVYMVDKFNIITKKRSSTRNKQLLLNRLEDFFPQNLERQLKNDHKIVNRHVTELIKRYNQLLISLLCYVLFWLGYVVFIVMRIFWIFRGHYSSLNDSEFGCVIASVLMSILTVYWLLLTPLFKILHFNKMANFGYKTWRLLQDGASKILLYFQIAVKYIVELVMSLFLLTCYINFFKYLYKSIDLKFEFWLALVTLILYQYMVLKIFSAIISKCFGFFMKKCKKIDAFVKKYTSNDILYASMKNCTYLSMILIYAMALKLDKSSTPIVSAIGVLFLLDTFLEKENDIIEKVENNK